MKRITGKQFDRLLAIQGSGCILLAFLCLGIPFFHRSFRNDLDERIVGQQSVPVETVQVILEESDVAPYIAAPSSALGFLMTGWLLLYLRKKRKTLAETAKTEQPVGG